MQSCSADGNNTTTVLQRSDCCRDLKADDDLLDSIRFVSYTADFLHKRLKLNKKRKVLDESKCGVISLYFSAENVEAVVSSVLKRIIRQIEEEESKGEMNEKPIQGNSEEDFESVKDEEESDISFSSANETVETVQSLKEEEDDEEEEVVEEDEKEKEAPVKEHDIKVIITTFDEPTNRTCSTQTEYEPRNSKVNLTKIMEILIIILLSFEPIQKNLTNILKKENI